MGDMSDGYIIRTRKIYEQALTDLSFLEGLLYGLLNNNNELPCNEYFSLSLIFKRISTILDECIMNCEFHELMEEGD